MDSRIPSDVPQALSHRSQCIVGLVATRINSEYAFKGMDILYVQSNGQQIYWKKRITNIYNQGNGQQIYSMEWPTNILRIMDNGYIERQLVEQCGRWSLKLIQVSVSFWLHVNVLLCHFFELAIEWWYAWLLIIPKDTHSHTIFNDT